jgi:adenylate cyclase
MLARRLRLWSGVVLFVFVALHLLNHALGLISLEAAEGGRLVFLAIWRNPLGTLVLYGSLLTHVGLVLWALYQRRHLRMPRWEVVRLLLGLAMPFLLIPHIFGTRILHDVFGVDDTYTHVVLGMWVLMPGSSVLQSVLLLMAWMHGCMGLHYWLKLKPWYPRALPLLRALAILWPTLALLGFVDIGRELAGLARDPGWLQRELANISHTGEEVAGGWGSIATGVFVLGVVAMLVARRARAALERRRGVVRLTYPDGRRVDITPGMTILEASRAAGIPHASLCGGRGRCSTCRSRVAPSEELPPPTPEEERVLRRVAAPPNVRLACQCRPTADLTVVPVLPAHATPADGFLQPTYRQGHEQEIAILFADLRSFTKFSEHRLPYDVVFMLNQYFASMGTAIERSGGHLDKFIGDGIMALFGVTSGPARGCRESLLAARAMAEALDELNRTLAHDLAEPLRIGIGIHAGHAIVGEMGHGRATTLTAIGDAVNTASRLESMNKEHGSQLIVSEDVAALAGLDLSGFPRQELEVRGRTTALAVRVVADARDLAAVLEDRARPAPA